MNADSKPTISEEDYLERIYELIQRKGYARPVEIAQELAIQQPSVTKMVQNLDAKGYLTYEKYRGFSLTPKGEKLALAIRNRHGILASFLTMIGVNRSTIDKDVEGIEHHISPKTLTAISQFVQFLQEQPAIIKAFLKQH